MGKKITSSKTFWVNMLVLVAAAVTGMYDTSVVADNPMLVTVFGAVIGIVNIALRMVTKVPVR
jgi:hypothetical protein